MKSVSTAEKTTKVVKKKSAATQPPPVKAKKTRVVVKNVPVSHGVGRRKAAVARVWLRRGSGLFVVNGKEVDVYFDTEPARISAISPLTLFQMAQGYDVEAHVIGGGLPGQADAVKLGVARAVLSLHEEARSVYRQAGILTVDSRVKERKKYGQKAARRKFQFVKR